jgi:hypothetical protein
VPLDDTGCRIIGWRHFGLELELGGKGDRAQVGLTSIDYLGRTGLERREAQIGQGPIAVHALETLGRADADVAVDSSLPFTTNYTIIRVTIKINA